MRIGVITLGRRGSGNLFSLQLGQHLSTHAGVFAAISAYAENLAEWQASGLEHFMVKTYRSGLGTLRSFVDRKALARLAQKIRTHHPDVLLFPMFYTLNPLIQRYLRDIPSVVVVHDPVSHPDLRWRVYGILENFSLRQAQRCLLLSRVFIPELQRRGVPAERIDLMVHGPLSYGNMPQASPGQMAGDPPLLLFFGRITAYKGLEVLLQAYRRLRVSRPVRLRIVGAGDLRPYAPLLAGLPDVEVVNRWVQEAEIPGFFCGVSAVVLPYTSASQSGVIATAAAYGLPVVATRIGGIPEQVRDGETGVLVEPGSVEELVVGLEQILDSRIWAAELGGALRREFDEQQSWTVAARQVYASCQRALETWKDS